MNKGDTRWRTLPDEERFIVLLEYWDGESWKPMPRPEKTETYPSRVIGPDA